MENAIFAALATSFAAFCIWLTVRIINRREHWTTLIVVLGIGVAAWFVWMGGSITWLPRPPIWME